MSTAERIEVEVVHVTGNNGVLVTDGQRECWVQGRWFTPSDPGLAALEHWTNAVHDGTASERIVGTVSRATFERGARPRRSLGELMDRRREQREAPISITIVRETAKAVATVAQKSNCDLETEGYELVWFPKSMVQNGQVPTWLVEIKLRELCRFRGDRLELGEVIVDAMG